MFCPCQNQENQVPHDVQQYKIKPAENGQPEHKTQLEEISLALGWVNTYSTVKPFIFLCSFSIHSSHWFLFSVFNSARCRTDPTVSKKVQWAGPCCHWPIRRLLWACALIPAPLVQKCRRMASIPAHRRSTHSHTHNHTCTHSRCSIEKHAQAPILFRRWAVSAVIWIFFLFCSVNELFFNDFPCLETRAYDNISRVCIFLSSIFFFLPELNINKAHHRYIRKRKWWWCWQWYCNFIQKKVRPIPFLINSHVFNRSSPGRICVQLKQQTVQRSRSHTLGRELSGDLWRYCRNRRKRVTWYSTPES